ncbi:conserved hypothetical protein [Caldicellulosiruptor hydrothermalis 108]|uniref:SLH domain-containing protein n=1 Tax=Caldicellulosiruptor hydrothermalis (strain DSM 18901 / VKM B-2411 / 108) TaxID=632292 RepID=E4QBM5_CALH1|nr:hypothetical protein [Caldicellulosiruptor hydrothermalis]ADQ06127.1 conserved hypothetical protein [Caldicellulosiruptor hydrothermalis 108]
MRKLLSFVVILSLLLSFTFPVAQAGTITQKVQAAINKIDYITAGKFVTSLLVGAKVKPDKPLDYWGKAVKMGLIPGEVKKDRPITRAQASYIVWKLINAVPELKDKNIPVEVRRVPPTEAFMRGICFFGGPLASNYDIFNRQIVGYDLTDFIQGYQLLVMEYKYADGRTEYKYVWDRYKGTSLAPGTYKYIDDPFRKILAEFKKKYPDKTVYAPRPYQKGWMFTLDPLVEVKKLSYPFILSQKRISSFGLPYTDSRQFSKPEDVVDALIYKDTLIEQLKIPLTRFDLAAITYLYHTQGREVFQGGIANYNIKEHPYFNMYLEDYLINYPRKYPTDHTRFAYYCKDYSKIPQLYREPMLRLADLGIITPDQSALYIGVYYFNAGKTLTRAEAVQMIARVFDKSKRDVLDEVTIKLDNYWVPKAQIGAGYYVYYDSQKLKFKSSENSYTFDTFGHFKITSATATFRVEELKSAFIIKTLVRRVPNEYGNWGLATFVYGGKSTNFNQCTVQPYDDFDDPKTDYLWENYKTILVNFVPIAYRDELQKDLKTYSFAKIKSMTTSRTIAKNYGDIYVVYTAGNFFGVDTIRYELYTTLPNYIREGKGYYLVLSAKPNTKYVQ